MRGTGMVFQPEGGLQGPLHKNTRDQATKLIGYWDVNAVAALLQNLRCFQASSGRYQSV